MERISRTPPGHSRRHPVRHILIHPDQAGRRIDNYLSAELRDVPRARIYQMLRRGEVRINGKRVRQGYRLEGGEELRIPPVSIIENPVPAPPRDFLLDLIRDSVIYEDRDFLAINKPAGLVVHSGSGRTYGVIEILRLLRDDADTLQLAHRLDRETSGVLLVAKNYPGLLHLQDCFRAGKVKKSYMALLKSLLVERTVIVNKPLSRKFLRSGERLSGISDDGKNAHTTFRLVRTVNDASLTKVEIQTGRTHQIRVHAASIGHPLAADDKYGDKAFNITVKRAGLKRLFLHAESVEIPAMKGKGTIHIRAPLADELGEFLVAYENIQINGQV